MINDFKDMLVVEKVQDDVNDIVFSGTAETFDYVRIPSVEARTDIKKLRAPVTDYAQAQGAMVFNTGLAYGDIRLGSRNGSIFVLERGRNKGLGKIISVVNGVAPNVGGVLVYERQHSIRPVINVRAEMIEYLRKSGRSKKMHKGVVGTSPSGLWDEEFVALGEYPQTFCTQEEENIIKNSMRPTGKKYSSYSQRSGDGDEMICTIPAMGNPKVVQITVDDNTKKLVKVEPIEWEIVSYETKYNPRKDEKDEYYVLMAKNALIGGYPFYPFSNERFGNVWQNSTVRGYLNGYDLSSRATKDVIACNALGGGDFTHKNNFLDEALRDDMINVLQQNHVAFAISPTIHRQVPTNTPAVPNAGEVVSADDFTSGNAYDTASAVQQTSEPQRKTPRKNQFGVTVQDNPMSVAEQIKFYIENGKSFMLHGASGVGKTRRIEEADPDFVSIVLRNGILPEEVIGKTIYLNNDKTTGGVWVPPAWYVSLCEKCEKEPDRNHVLFIDEITNVRPSEQSLVYHLVLNNSISPNLGKLPKNCVVVSAGNSKEESEAAYNMPEPLFRRFEGHIELKPNIKSWLEWGSELKDGHPKIHPLVASFVATFGDKVFYSSYDAEEPPKFAIDPRGWEQVSNIIYSNNGVVAKELIANKVGISIASSFMSFAQTPPLSAEDILTDNYDLSEIPSNPLQQYSTMMSLRNVEPCDVEKAREFIATRLDGELLPTFDSIWVGGDSERAIIINDLKNKGKNCDFTKDDC